MSELEDFNDILTDSEAMKDIQFLKVIGYSFNDILRVWNILEKGHE